MWISRKHILGNRELEIQLRQMETDQKEPEFIPTFSHTLKTREIVDEILDLCEEKEMSVSEVQNIPTLLSKAINQNIRQLHKQNFRKLKDLR